MKLSEFRAKVALAATIVIAIVLIVGAVYSGAAAFWAGGLAAAGQALICGLALWGLVLARQQKELRELPTVQSSKPASGDLGGFKMSLGDDAPVAANIAPKASDEVKTLESGFQRMVVALSAALLLGLAVMIGYMVYRNLSMVGPGKPITIPVIDPLGVVIGIGALAIHIVALTLARVSRQTQGTGEAVASTLVVGLPGIIAVTVAAILAYMQIGYASEIAAGIVGFFMVVQGLELATNATRSYAGIEEFDQEPVDLQALPLVPMLSSVWVSGLKMLAVQSFGLTRESEDRFSEPGVFARMMPRAIVALVILAVFISCFRIVGPGEVAVRERLGQATPEDIKNPLQSGLHFMAPWPIDTLVTIPVDAVQKLYVGVNENEVTGLDFSFWAFKHTESGEPDFITGDQQMVGGFIIVWWRVKDPTAFYNNLSHSEHVDTTAGEAKELPIYEAIIQEAANQAVSQTFGTHTMEQIIGGGRQEVQEHTRKTLQEKMDAIGSGIDIIDLSIKDVHPPKGADDMASAGGVVRGPASAYEEVVAAREDAERFINDAAAYKTFKVNLAKGEAAAILDTARAYKASRINNASGERDRRAALIEQFSKQQEVGRNWMTYQALDQSLPGVNKIILGRKVESPTIWQPGKDNNLPVRPMPGNGQ